MTVAAHEEISAALLECRWSLCEVRLNGMRAIKDARRDCHDPRALAIAERALASSVRVC